MEREERLDVFASAVEGAGLNLVSARAVGEVRERHVPECAALAEQLPQGPLEVLDVGSGGGFPGLVIAACRPDLSVTLLDATRKKTDFLERTAAAMGVDVEVVNARAEDLLRERRGRYGIVTARAVAPMHRLLGWTVPFLAPDGLLYAVKGDRWSEELDTAADELRRLDAVVVATPDDTPDAAARASASAPKVVIIGRAA